RGIGTAGVRTGLCRLTGHDRLVGHRLIGVASEDGMDFLLLLPGTNREARPAVVNFAVDQELQSQKAAGGVFPRTSTDVSKGGQAGVSHVGRVRTKRCSRADLNPGG